MSNINNPPRKDRFVYSPTGSIPKREKTMYMGGSLGRPDLKQTSSTCRVNLPSASGSSYKIFHHHSHSNQMFTNDSSGTGARPSLNPRHTFNGTYTGLGGISSDDNSSLGHRARRSGSSPSHKNKQSTGLVFSSIADRELASIDKINDPLADSLVCAGKSHVGIYRFNREDRSIRLVQDVTKTDLSYSRLQSSSMFASRRNRQSKFSTISDVKSGFQNFNNYIAVCANSTSISIFDINKPPSETSNPLIMSLNEHKRSVNSFDFNMVQPHLLISGGQDGCAKIWDLRANNMKNNGRCEVNINTAYDSIRDIKWMPSYSFVSPISNEGTPSSMGSSTSSTPRSNSGFKFSSIHDSGVLLKFDLRQPQQFEKKINAHTGPGLCLNWHPNLDYVVTGGRDGKCCLWYIGDRDIHANNQNSVVNGYIPSNPSVFPETTINFGSPITKLKFCPAYNSEPHNSLLAISSMGDEAQVGIYSLARKYIPKYLLETSAASMGLVWWDSENIFTIDKRNRINGWDLTHEPTVLENLPKTVTTWRDIEGNGLLFVNQDEGTYDITDPYFVRENMHDHTANNSNVMLSNASINQPEMGNKRIHSPPTPNPNERPSMFKMNSAFNNKSFVPSPISSTPLSTTSSIHSGTIPIGTHDNPITSIESPLVFTVDLPKIIGSMRIEQISKFQSLRNKKKIDKESLTKLQESPIEVFKYLARELEFSIKHDGWADQLGRKNSVSHQSGSESLQEDNEDTGKNLMKKFGLAENGTWTNLINKKNDQQERKISEAGLGNISNPGTKSTYQDTSSNDGSSKYSGVHLDGTSRTDSNSIKHSNQNSDNHDTTSSINQPLEPRNERIMKLHERMSMFIDFLSVASHNASVYADINDALNFKVWVLIRDTIMWDLKKMDSLLPKSNDPLSRTKNHDTESVNSAVVEDTVIPLTNLRKQSMSSEYSRFNESIRTSSLVEEHPQIFRSPSDDSGVDPTDREAIVNLRNQLRRTKEEPAHKFATAETLRNIEGEVMSASPGEQRALSNESAFDPDDEEEEEKDEEVKPKDGSPEGIPILNNRRQRLSFIDTFLSDAHSPLGHSDEEHIRSSSFTKGRTTGGPYSESFDHHSVRSKVSSLDSIPSTYQSRAPFLKRLSDTKKLVPTIKETFSYEDVLKSVDNLDVLAKTGIKNDGNEQARKIVTKPSPPPWDTRTILRQVYQQAAEGGNILLAVNILLLFQDVYQLTSLHVVKSSVSEFITLLHRYELFEISTALLKYCGWDDIMGPESEQSDIRLFCDRCGELIVNEPSKEKYTRSLRQHHSHDQNKADLQFGFWYCDNCKKPNTLCVLCERPIKKLAIGLLECGHEGHFDCFREWFLKEGMTTCPSGCTATLNI
ncbi:similar to Saccharomyces cerevisiae YOL138C RTC1 Subunit of the SEA (Seh1-associated) complex, a coatomer-related complex that associates dynamically with the vacuole [Maudiozyma saulgeensis]|uniref:Restriction of telomere capping protein 1 n=1 Tax=Maudiozyma saulgeensis TaxID=1789683 RepID=A0A1X7RAF6_9SACH|nr:similar to Saccharomyces cerevisiae YOL138C RTC1 Subunit of the SEA (Seh1-associated) complex, a coatomer-related complex that associates dynamically with the vacuole [Kazachstania saulgeensis]